MANKLLDYDVVLRALKHTGGNMAAAARLLDVSDRTVRRFVNGDPNLRMDMENLKAESALTYQLDMKFTESEVAKAIIEAKGNLTTAAKILRCSRTTVHSYVNKFKSVRETYRDANDIFLDLVENALLENALAGNVTAQIYALKTKGRTRGWTEKEEAEEVAIEPRHIELKIGTIAPAFTEVYQAIEQNKYAEYVLAGGRGSTKSSFASLVFIMQLINNPEVHGLALRQVAATLRDSVFSQLEWAIDMIGVTDDFHTTKNPLEMTYLPTEQKIYFRGADDPLKIKSIKPRFGYIGILWFEELDQFGGDADVRSIVQSAMRGGSDAIQIKSYNPPRSLNNWVNKEEKRKKPGRLVHRSTYLDVPEDWLGQVFLNEAEDLKQLNPLAYDHEYMGLAVGTGGTVFENLKLQEITDEQISQFERPLDGLDWGYYPDPCHYGRVYFDVPRRTLYIYGELRGWKWGNRRFYEEIQKYKLEAGFSVKVKDPDDKRKLKTVPDNLTVICDSAEPKSIGDFRDYGAQARAAEKGPESVMYSMKWLQSLVAIVIDPDRCPYAAQEFEEYEYETNKDGEYITAYPDKNNHAIDFVRYATNRIWVRRGQ